MKGMSPLQQKRMMKKAGINFESVDDAREVIIRTGECDYVFKDPDVTIMMVQGQRTWQVTGEPEKRAPGGAVDHQGDRDEAGEEQPAEPQIPPEDIMLVAQQAGVSEEAALEALKETGGNPAEAIIKLMK
jgi:nascent polypeptide-associated complex subunit alpha